ncbi:MAG: HEPN domain-containing protein [Deltaproteobacteria bacterium]|nr:HEPN domain-containing protein [Deltaproteobacteria bacterium]
MKPPDDPEVAAWLAKAEEDSRAVGVLRAHAPTLDSVIGFHCQQAAEKQLKALMVAVGLIPPRTHDLVALVEALELAVPQVTPVLEDAQYLNRFAVIPRYPVLVDPAETSGEVGAVAERRAGHVREVVSAVFEAAAAR